PAGPIAPVVVVASAAVLCSASTWFGMVTAGSVTATPPGPGAAGGCAGGRAPGGGRFGLIGTVTKLLGGREGGGGGGGDDGGKLLAARAIPVAAGPRSARS